MGVKRVSDVCAGHLVILAEGSDVTELVPVSACHLDMPGLRLPDAACESCSLISAWDPREVVLSPSHLER